MTHAGIECFLAICRHKTGSAAAQALYITQPSLSARLKLLEQELGSPLFYRHKGCREMTLTATGKAFYELALECAEARLAVAGQMNLLRHPAYPLDRARALIGFLNDRQQVRDLLEPSVTGIRVLLGREWHPSLEGSVMLLVPYMLGDRGQGTIGVVGPERMNYADVIPRIQYFATALGQMLGDLFEESSALDI